MKMDGCNALQFQARIGFNDENDLYFFVKDLSFILRTFLIK